MAFKLLKRQKITMKVTHVQQELQYNISSPTIFLRKKKKKEEKENLLHKHALKR